MPFYTIVSPAIRRWPGTVAVSAIWAIMLLAGVASADQIVLNPGPQVFRPGSNANQVFIQFIANGARRGLQFDLLYDPATAEPIDVKAEGRQHGLQLYHSISPPGVLHVLIYGEPDNPVGAEVATDSIASVAFAVPGTVRGDSLRIGAIGMAVSGDLAAISIPSRAISVPILGAAPVQAERPPERFALYQSAPNPFTSSTLFRFDVPRQARVKLAVYDVAGHLVRVLQDGDLHPGRYSRVWDGSGARGMAVPNGIYFYVAQMGGQSIARKTVRSQ